MAQRTGLPAGLGEINRLTGVLVAHIRTEDRRVADHVKKNG